MIETQATDNNVIWRMNFAYWTTRLHTYTEHTHTEYVILHYHGNSGFANALLCYVFTCISCLFTIFSDRIDAASWFHSLLHDSFRLTASAVPYGWPLAVKSL